jgi:hypothetical protein
MAVQSFGYKFAEEGQNHPTDQWPVIDLNPEEWREVEESSEPASGAFVVDGQRHMTRRAAGQTQMDPAIKLVD